MANKVTIDVRKHSVNNGASNAVSVLIQCDAIEARDFYHKLYTIVSKTVLELENGRTEEKQDPYRAQ